MLRRRSYLPRGLELILRPMAWLLYRVRSRGTELIPSRGGVVLIANHLSYVDAVVLQLACPRPLRFVGYRGKQAHRFFDWVFRVAGVIPISESSPFPALRRAVASLAKGEVVCLFPEGGISRSGQLMRIRKGFEIMARRAGVPVVPAAIDGLWGSVFSFAGQKFLWKSPRLMPTPVFVLFGAPMPPERANAAAARRALLDLGAEAFAARPALRCHLGRETVRSLAKRPGRIVVIDWTSERREMAAAQLLGAAAVLGRWLKKEVAEKRVGIVLPPGAGAMLANLAVVCAGKIPVNLNFTAARQTVSSSIELGGIGTVLSAEAMRAKLPAFPWPERTFDLRALIAAAGGRRAIAPWAIAAWILPNQWVADLLGLPRTGDEAEAALLFTSGSAADPKGVVLTHRNLLANCEQVASLSILPRTCTMLGCLPIFHSFGFTVTLWYPLLRSCGLVTVPSPLDIRRILDAIGRESVTVFIGAPTFLRPVLARAQPAELRSLHLVVAGAEGLPEDISRRFREKFHLEIMQGYGMTEAAPVVSVNQYDPPLTTLTADPQVGNKTGSVGRLLPGITVRISDPETGADLPLAATGLISLRGANIFPGYLEDCDRTRRNGGWFATGDLGRFDEDGFLTVAGRISRFSKIGGEMVPHGAVERALIIALGLDEAENVVLAVTSVSDAGKGEALVLLVATELTAASAREKLSFAGLPQLWIPKRVVWVEKIPLLGSGKLDIAGCKRLALENDR